VQSAISQFSKHNPLYSHFENGLVKTENAVGSDPLSYEYDSLNRLQSITHGFLTSDRVESFAYNDLGSLNARTDTLAGNTFTSYQTTHPHFIDAITTPRGENAYGYDFNGNVQDREGPDVPGTRQTFTYTPFDLPSSITTGSGTGGKLTQFEYSADEERMVRRDPDETRHFVAGLYERLVQNGSTSTLEERFRLYAGDREIGQIVRAGGGEQTLFFHADHEGSIDTISTNAGEHFRQEFDAFGAPAGSFDSELTRSGFTCHEHDRDLALIDMMGRVYDPLGGQFTSADPITQAPFWSQGLNRYAYAFNDPVNNTDPSGFQANDVASHTVGGTVAAGCTEACGDAVEQGGRCRSTVFA
jgi:RHS repeat-associated protein